MNSPIWLDGIKQTLAIRSAQLFKLAILQQLINEFRPLISNLLERCCISAESSLRLLARRKLFVFVQNLPQLCRRIQIERLPRQFMQYHGKTLRLVN